VADPGKKDHAGVDKGGILSSRDFYDKKRRHEGKKRAGKDGFNRPDMDEGVEAPTCKSSYYARGARTSTLGYRHGKGREKADAGTLKPGKTPLQPVTFAEVRYERKGSGVTTESHRESRPQNFIFEE